ncbi:hypothetical protein ACKI2N_021345 [Cupriavidus sp. 30B13]|uniref:hypothetical protein n=1 Tax=Cupriavidus sp. 30B13 TaxID=3384241 RepID=UPI003B8F61BD
MKTPPPLTVYRVLLEFAELNKLNQQIFIELMNDFLMISPQKRREFVEQWHAMLGDGTAVEVETEGGHSTEG